jgi:regulator of sigma E protease
MSIIITVLLLGVIVFIHEFGHFITAKIFHMPILEFAIGMGPKIISKKINTTVYSVRAIPFGGFVSIDGMEVDSENEVENGFNTQNPLKRLIVLSAGVFMNFLSGIIALFILFSVTGVTTTKDVPAKIKNILVTSEAHNVLKKGDIIIAFNGEKIENWKELTQNITELNAGGYKGQEIDVRVLRDNKETDLKTKLTSVDTEEGNGYILGVEVDAPKMSVPDRVKYSVLSFFKIMEEMIKGLAGLVTGKVGLNNLTGPVGLTKVVGEAYSSGGIIILMNLFVLISLNIGLLNLLPFPALDGGRIIFVFMEMIGIKVNKKIEEKFHIVGFSLLIGLMVFVIFNDIKNF